jgi:hypothetical protein
MSGPESGSKAKPNEKFGSIKVSKYQSVRVSMIARFKNLKSKIPTTKRKGFGKDK